MSEFIPTSPKTRFLKTQEHMNAAEQMAFHRVAIKDVKGRMGESCTYLSHMMAKDPEGNTKVYFLAHLIIDGKKKVVRVNSGLSDSSGLNAENYKVLLTQLSNYVTGKETL